jgi:hypothetical protein
MAGRVGQRCSYVVVQSGLPLTGSHHVACALMGMVSRSLGANEELPFDARCSPEL